MLTIKLPKKVAVAFSSAAVFLVAAGLMITATTAVSYGGTCSKLTGFPGLLQRAGLVAQGGCASRIGGAVCNAGAPCTAPGNVPGTCHNTATSGPASCACVANCVSGCGSLLK